MTMTATIQKDDGNRNRSFLLAEQNSTMARSGNVSVAFLARPSDESCVQINQERGRVSVRNNDMSHHFTFDRVFDQDARQSAVYKETVAPLVTDFIAGRNCCVFVYGEAGSGKTHTIMGPGVLESITSTHEVIEEGDEDKDDDLSSLGSAGVSRHQGLAGPSTSTLPPPGHIEARKGVQHKPLGRASEHSDLTETRGNGMRAPLHVMTENSGIVPRIVKEIYDVFQRRRRRNSGDINDEPKLSFSFVEVYDERIIDLLDLEAAGYADDDDYSLSVRSTPEYGVYIEDATEIRCRVESDVSAAVEVALATREKRFASNGATDNSSHSVLILKLERYSKSRGKRAISNFFLVDLANSALVRKPPPDAPPRFVRECKSVKKSLGALRKCIRALALSQNSPTPPYGESTLTKLLHNALVRGSGISMIVTANPLFEHAQESLSAIRFGAYVAGQKGEETEEMTRKPLPDTRLAKRRASEAMYVAGQKGEETEETARKASADTRRYSAADLPKRRASDTPYHSNEKHHHQDEVKRMDDMSEDGSIGIPELLAGYEELESAGEILRKLPNEEFGHTGSKGEPRHELSQVTSLLDTAAKKIEADLTDTKNELKQSGFDESLSAEEMQRQLMDVTKELETMRYDGHLASQIQNDLLSAQEELKRLSVTVDETSQAAPLQPLKRVSSLETHFSKNSKDRDLAAVERDSTPVRSGSRTDLANGQNNQQSKTSGNKPQVSVGSQETDKLLTEVAELKKTNEMLHRQQAAKAQELAIARQEIQELKSANEAGPSVPPDTEEPIQSLSEDGLDRIEVSNDVHVVKEIETIVDKTDDWDENQIEYGPSPVCVCLRLRPMTKLERNRRSRSCIEVHEGGREFTVDSPLDGEYDFCFDHVFDIDSNQEEVYETVGAPIVDQLLGGVNCAVMVYGLAGSGKSHTLAGKLPETVKDENNDESSDDNESQATEGTPTEEDAGFSPRLVADLFRGMKDSPITIEFRITCSYVCIYLEKMFDLLDPRFDKTLVVRDSTNGIQIEGAVEAFCFDEEDIIHLIRRGAACRKLIGTKLTMDTSRSHSILTLNIEQHHVHSGRMRRSYLKLVELAGFEVTSKGKGQSMQETKIIHKSFSALGNVIKSLTEGNPYAPYRESKLTSIVKEALGGNCKTTLFITASPSSYHISETINSIRLGQRVRRVTNNPRINIDASVENYRIWLLDSEIKLGELSSLVTQLAQEVVEASDTDTSVENSFSPAIWESIQAIANEEESMSNPCREALIMDEDEFLEPGQQKWRALTIELARRLPSEKLQGIRTERNKAQSLLSDIQSESVVLRRQNDLLVSEKRKKEEELAVAYRENRKMTMQNSEVEHTRQVAENRARDAIIFLRYMRTLCWKLRKDVERDRPIDISDITSHMQGAPDLSGLVDLDTMMIETGFIYNKEIEIEKVETEYFDYLQKAGLIIDEEQVAAEEEVDELAFLDDGLGSVPSDSRWRKAQTPKGRIERISDSVVSGSASIDDSRNSCTLDTFMGMSLPWLAPKPAEPMQRFSERTQWLGGVRNTRGERELQRDLQNMANKCVELQMELNEQRQLMEALTNKTTTLKMKKLSQECLNLAKERDRMMHNAKAATWKLQELHVVNKLLSKQSAEAKQQIRFLEEGFQRLQESFRSTVQEGLETDQALRDRVKALQSIVDSLTGPSHKDDASDNDSDEDSLGSTNPLFGKVNLPLRGRMRPEPRSFAGLVDPSGSNSICRCLIVKQRGKRGKKSPSLFGHHKAKFVRKSYKFGTALIGEHRKRIEKAYERGKWLTLPLFLDDDGEDGDDGSQYTDEEYYDGDESAEYTR